MRWNETHESSDVEDRRAEGPTGGGGGSGVLGVLFSLAFSRFGIVGGLVVVGLYLGASFLFGQAPEAPRRPASAHQPGVSSAQGADRDARFVGFVLDDAQTTWTALFAKNHRTYTRAKLVLFTGSTRTACGIGESATGPFYCPGDQHVYLDLRFFDTLANRLKAQGDFAQAYVVAHEIGHHVQHQLGDDRRSHARGADAGSVRLELQADCYAGVWAHSTQQRALVEKGDIDEVMRAAAAIGDDALQRNNGAVRPETFSHGSSEQRKRWFGAGLRTGNLASCDTFAAADL